MPLPDFVIVGAMRCGTTSLYRYLGDHPDVTMAPKELGFFTEHFDRGLGWYETQFDAKPAQLRGEATADYLARDSAMQRLASTAPHAKLIASLRNPVERAWSHYLLLRERGKETRSFAAALDDELARIATDGPEARGAIYTLHGLYDVHLQRALALYPRDRLLVSVFERMAADPASSYQSMCRFLGIDADYVPQRLGKPINRYVTFRSLRVRDRTKALPSPIGRIVARLNTRRHTQPPTLPPSERERLQEFYAPRIARVEQLMGQPLPEWR